MVYHHIAKFGGHRYCNSSMFLVCHIIKKDHITKVSGDYNHKSSSRQVTILPRLVA